AHQRYRKTAFGRSFCLALALIFQRIKKQFRNHLLQRCPSCRSKAASSAAVALDEAERCEKADRRRMGPVGPNAINRPRRANWQRVAKVLYRASRREVSASGFPVQRPG